MTTGAPGAVFFLGTRAHYQVLQQPDSHFDAENGNSETIYRNPSTWDNDVCCVYHGAPAFAGRAGYSVLDNVNVKDEDKKSVVKRRSKRRSSDALCQCKCDNMKPSQLNNVEDDNAPPKEKTSRRSLFTFLSSLSRRKKRLVNKLDCLKHIETALTTCTYRESCRCLDCQSSYFDCEESEYDQSDDDSEFTMYVAQMQSQAKREPPPEEDDDEVFVDQAQSDDSTSTDMLIDPKKMSVSSDSSVDPESMDIGVAAGTPLLLNFLLNHPVTCSIQ